MLPRQSARLLPSGPAVFPCITFTVCNRQRARRTIPPRWPKQSPLTEQEIFLSPDSHIVRFFEGRPAAAADDRATVTAHQRVVNRLAALRTVQSIRFPFARFFHDGLFFSCQIPRAPNRYVIGARLRTC